MPRRHEEHEAVPAETEAVAQRVIGACIAVHRELGPGYLEMIYEEALAIELERQGISFIRQAPIAVKYRGFEVGHGYLDFLVENRLVLELKAVDEFHPKHTAQVMSYLKATDLRLGLLVNFQTRILMDGFAA